MEAEDDLEDEKQGGILAINSRVNRVIQQQVKFNKN